MNYTKKENEMRITKLSQMLAAAQTLQTLTKLNVKFGRTDNIPENGRLGEDSIPKNERQMMNLLPEVIMYELFNTPQTERLDILNYFMSNIDVLEDEIDATTFMLDLIEDKGAPVDANKVLV